MDINAKKVKQHRSQLGWTQQVLADSCGVSLRTIQRVERYGTASNETLMSLCSVLEIEQQELLIRTAESENDTHKTTSTKKQIILSTSSMIVGIALGALLMFILMK